MITVRGLWLRRLMAVSVMLLLIVSVLLQAREDDRSLPLEVTEFLTYSLDDGHTFTLQPGERSVKLVTWLVGPRPWARDTRHTRSFQLEVRVLDAEGERVWQDQFWIRARSSWIEDHQGRLREPAWVEEEGLSASDDRLTQLDVTGLVPAGGFLEVLPAHVPEGYSVRFVAFREGERGAVARIRWQEGPEASEREGAARRVGPYGFDDLPESWRDNLAATVWQRLAALPKPGTGDPTTERVWTTFHRDPYPDAPAWGLPVPVGGAAAFNVEGPASFQATWWSVDGDGPMPVKTQLRLVDQSGVATVRDLGVVGRVGPVQVPAEVVSIQVAVDPEASGPRILRARTSGDQRDRSYGDPPRWVIDESQGLQRVAPDLRTIELWRVGPHLDPLTFRIAPDEAARIVLRERLPPGPLPGFGEAPAEPRRTLTAVVVKDRDGEVLGRSTVELFPIPTAFERYTQGDDPERARVAEPEEFHLNPSDESRWIRISSTAAVDVGLRVQGLDPAPPRLERRYEEPAGMAELARYEPYARKAWRARAPEGVETLTLQDRAIRVDAQVRLDEPRDDSRLTRARIKHTQPLSGPYELVATAARSGAGPHTRSRLGADPAELDVGADRRLVVQYRVDVADVGSTIWLIVDGERIPVTATAAGGSWRIEDLSSERVSVSIEGAGLFLARASGGEPWSVNRMWRLEPGEALTIPVPSGAGGISLYSVGTRPNPPARLQWAVRQQESAQVISVLAAESAVGEHVLASASGGVRALSFGGDALSRLEPFHIDFEERLEGQPGWLDLTLVGSQGPVWVRVTSTWAEPRETSERHWELVAP